MWQPEQPPSQTVASSDLTHCFSSLHHRAGTAGSGRASISRDRLALVEERAGRADLDALAALGAGLGRAPRLVQVGDDAGVAAAAGDVPGVRAFDLPADAHAAGAEDAAVVVHAEALVRGVHRPASG